MGYDEACEKLVPEEKLKYLETLQTLQSFGFSDFCENLRKLRTYKDNYLENFFADDRQAEQA
jgi:hypothetical protein